MDDYDEQIRRLCSKNNKTFPRLFKKPEFAGLWNYILSQTKVLQHFEASHSFKFSVSTYVNWTLNHRTAFPCCKTCGKAFDARNVAWNAEYPSFCSNACMNKSPEHISRCEATMMDRYGVAHPAQLPAFYEKMEQTNLRLYGVKNCWQLPKVQMIASQPEVKERRMQSLMKTNMELYGVPWFVQSDEFKKKTHTSNGVSKEEKEVVSWLKSIVSDEVIVGSFAVIPPKQLDIYVPSKAVAIEFNGTYYHSLKKDGDVRYHLNKTTACENLGIKLVHIWEDEWSNKKDDIKQFILGVLNGTILFSSFVKHESDGILLVDRSKFSKCAIPDSYEVIGETQPEIVLRAKADKQKYKVPDCGKLLLRCKNEV